jgi:hypothetical protein
MDDYLLGGSLLQREGSTRRSNTRENEKDQTLQDVIDEAAKDIEKIFGKVRSKPVARANAA